jgi:hypothetical protein
MICTYFYNVITECNFPLSLFFEDLLSNYCFTFILFKYFQTTWLSNVIFKVVFQLPWQTHHLGMYQILILQNACRYKNNLCTRNITGYPELSTLFYLKLRSRWIWFVWIEIKMRPSMFCKCNIICYSCARHGIRCYILNVRFIYPNLWGIHTFGNGNMTLHILSSTGITLISCCIALNCNNSKLFNPFLFFRKRLGFPYRTLFLHGIIHLKKVKICYVTAMTFQLHFQDRKPMLKLAVE